MQPTVSRSNDGAGLALVLGMVFLCLSYLRIWGDTGSARFGSRILDAALGTPLLGTALGTQVLRFAATQVVVHAAFGLAAWALAVLTKTAWPATRTSLRSLTLLWFVVLALWVLMANAWWFPWTSLGRPYADAVRAGPGDLSVFAIASLSLLAAIVCTLGLSAARYCRVHARSRLARGAGLALVCSSVAIPVIGAFDDAARRHDDSPNVIVIGLDSLRDDYVGSPAHDLTPMLDAHIEQATRFTDTTTPLARTFPAWISILTGRHPHTTGAYVNLIPRELVREGETLPAILRRHGYRTVFAMDESRFANIDESFGFDEVIAPPMGASDFLLEFFSDAPVSNLIVNTHLGRLLYPYTHANRAAARTYDPDSFVERVADELELDEPTFLAIHLTLVHWPYHWADSPTVDTGSVETDVLPQYEQTVARLDRQFGLLLGELERRGALDNAIVVTLSDHGESLGEPSPLDHANAEAAVYGHGTDVFALPQYQVLLALQSFGETPLDVVAGAEVHDPASLEDIAPTLLAALGIDEGHTFDGRSLLPLLARRGESANRSRIRFIETEFNPPELAAGTMPSTSSLSEVVGNYHVDPATDRVRFRSEFVDDILRNRQYAALAGGRMLASIPAANDREQHLVWRPSADGPWQWLDAPPDAADAGYPPEVIELWLALSDRFDAVRTRPVIAATRELLP